MEFATSVSLAGGTALVGAPWGGSPGVDKHGKVYVYRLRMSGDTDGDGDIDTEDFSEFEQCLTGPGVSNPACVILDSDLDGDFDLVDFAMFQTEFTGP